MIIVTFVLCKSIEEASTASLRGKIKFTFRIFRARTLAKILVIKSETNFLLQRSNSITVKTGLLTL